MTVTRASQLTRTFLAATFAGVVALASCSPSSGNGSSSTCGAAGCNPRCSTDNDCSLGTYCAAGSCSADCGVNGVACFPGLACSPRGRCEPSGATGGVTGAGGTTGNGGDVVVIPTSGGSSGVSADAGICDAEVTRGETVPVDMFVMWDRSTSMDETVAGGRKWDLVKQAFQTFLRDSASTGLGVGLGYFPTPGGTGFGQNNASCNVSDYSTAAVPIGTLPANAQALATSLDTTPLVQGTPTRVAMEGAVQQAKAWATAHSDHKVIIVLQTDGEPNVCNSTVQAVSAVAASAMAGNPSLPTYVIGVGSALASLNAIAQAGGTGQAIVVDTSQNTTAQFLDALNKIRGSAVLPCEFSIPARSDIDFKKVNVKFTPSSGAGAVSILQAANVGACPAEGGWYYEGPAASPTRIKLCPSSCNAVVADPKGQVDVLLGCATETIIPR